ncbi:hypothetical protein FACS1894176_08420 [Bacteroidia bacterium]|nr:hypothetical protein FACS1894176_08420 [Bacteroidia bacterium]
MKNELVIFIFALLLGCISCNKGSDRLEAALQFAGDNRVELEKVLQQYSQNPADSLKYKAAVFLIENMPYHHSCKNDKLAKYQNELYQTAIDNNCTGEEAVKILEQKYGKLNPQEYEIVQDAHVITADYLIRNIEQAFFVWQKQAWGKQITFDDFCEQILPYRIKDEPLDDWREVYYNRFQPVLDSLLTNRNDPLEAVNILRKSLESIHYIYYDQKPAGYHLAPALNLLENRIGDCYEQANLAVYAMRALGIPGGIDSYLQHPYGNSQHVWNYVPDTLGNVWEFSLYGYVTRTAKREKPIMGSVFRQCFGVQKESLPIITKGKKDLPPLLNNAFIKDVSEYYLHDVSISIKANIWKKNDILYLCTFAYDQWVPVMWARWKDGQFTFPSIEKNMLYLPAYYKDGQIIPAGAPCLVNKYGITDAFQSDKTRKQKILISRKYPKRGSWDNYNKRIIGGQFQVANDSAFTDAVTLHTVNQASNMLWSTIELPETENYRYLRYLSAPNGSNNMAEIQVFDKTGKLLKGNVTGSEGSYQNKSNNNKYAVFDDDPLTFFDALELDGAWSGLDFGSPQSIAKINYVFRNDDNNIRLGDEYELFYWDDKWCSLGRWIAGKGIVEFDEVPVGALLWLHNYTRGREERVFVYLNGEQLFIGEI